jgi:FAD/FMN-containing dehydrogenase
MSEARGGRRQYSDGEIIDHIRRLANGDTPPTCVEFDADPAAPAHRTVRKWFGSWNAAVEAAGFEARTQYGRAAQGWSDDEILDHIRRLADGDTPPTGVEFDADDDAPARRTATNHFGSWNAAVEAAGFEPRAPRGHRYDADELLDWLVAHRCELGAWPTISTLAAWPGPGACPYQRVFGSLAAAIEAAEEVASDE